jgi:hypothetical protein
MHCSLQRLSFRIEMDSHACVLRDEYRRFNARHEADEPVDRGKEA